MVDLRVIRLLKTFQIHLHHDLTQDKMQKTDLNAKEEDAIYHKNHNDM